MNQTLAAILGIICSGLYIRHTFKWLYTLNNIPQETNVSITK